MKLHFEEGSLSKKQECSALTTNLKMCDGENGQCTRQHSQDIRHPAEPVRLWSTRAPGYDEVREEASKR